MVEPKTDSSKLARETPLKQADVVRLAYQLLLGREAANDGAVAALSNIPDIFDLRNHFLKSKEYEIQQRSLRLAELLYVDEPIIRSDTEKFDVLLAADSKLESMIRDIISADARAAQSAEHLAYTTLHAARFFDQVRAVLAVRQKMLGTNRSFRVLDVGTSPVTSMYGKVAHDIDVFTANLPASGPPEVIAERYGAKRHYYIDLETELLSDRYPNLVSEPFDMIVFCEVVEHIRASPEELFADLLKIVRTGGILVISTPNAMSARHLVQLASGKKPDLIYKKHDPSGRRRQTHLHVREYTLAEIRNALLACGATILLHATKNYYSDANKSILASRFHSAHDGQIVIAKK